MDVSSLSVLCSTRWSGSTMDLGLFPSNNIEKRLFQSIHYVYIQLPLGALGFYIVCFQTQFM
jgi:hypothetical protein